MTLTVADLQKMTAQEIVNLLPVCVDCHEHKVGAAKVADGWVCADCQKAAQ